MFMCCEKPGDTDGCTWGRHRVDDGLGERYLGEPPESEEEVSEEESDETDETDEGDDEGDEEGYDEEDEDEEDDDFARRDLFNGGGRKDSEGTASGMEERPSKESGTRESPIVL